MKGKTVKEVAEHIEKAANKVEFAIDDLAVALNYATSIDRPEGRNLADKITMAYLSDCLELAKQLQAKLERIA